MILKLGSDIVCLSRFEKSFLKNRRYFVEHVFSQKEVGNKSPQSLAGIFAAKEATLKALGMKAGEWKEIRVAHKKSGKPYLAEFPHQEASKKQWGHELTIAHDGDYVIANVIFYQ